MYMSSSPIFELWSESFTATAKSLGMKADKAAKNEPVNILQVQEENYIIAFDRRQFGYQLYETSGKIKTQEQVMSGQNITVKDLSDVTEDAYNDRSFMPFLALDKQ